MITREPVQSFDLPDDLEADHVVIYPNDNPDESHFEAIPFTHTDRNGRADFYDEMDSWPTSDKYQRAIAQRADIDIKDIKLKQSSLATYGFDEIHR